MVDAISKVVVLGVEVEEYASSVKVEIYRLALMQKYAELFPNEAHPDKLAENLLAVTSAL